MLQRTRSNGVEDRGVVDVIERLRQNR